MKKIPLSQGKFALVDDENFEWLNQWKWYCSSNGYVVRHSKMIKGVRKDSIFMHRVILKTPQKFNTDHINRNTLDNQKSNLRIVTTSQNNFNRKKLKNNTSNFQGITWHKQSGKWQAQFQYNKKMFYLGLFNNKQKAFETYYRTAREKGGEYFRL